MLSSHTVVGPVGSWISANLKDIQGLSQQGLALLWIKMNKLYLVTRGGKGWQGVRSPGSEHLADYGRQRKGQKLFMLLAFGNTMGCLLVCLFGWLVGTIEGTTCSLHSHEGKTEGEIEREPRTS